MSILFKVKLEQSRERKFSYDYSGFFFARYFYENRGISKELSKINMISKRIGLCSKDMGI